MSWVLDPPVRIGTAAFSAITEKTVWMQNIGSVFALSGGKRPKLILQHARGEVRGFDFSGGMYDDSEIEHLYPGAVAELKARLAASD